jgi:hypothetical protein
MFYTYLYLREDGTPYYVGKGVRYRAFGQKTHRVKVPIDRSRILVQEHPSEEDAFFAEKFLIAYYGRKDLGTGRLLNMTDGGEGASGHVLSEEHKAKIGRAHTGQKRTEHARQHMREARLGVSYGPHSAAHNTKISEALKGRKGKPMSAEHKAMLLSLHLGKKRSLEVRANMRRAQQGKKMPREAVERMIATRRARGSYGPAREVNVCSQVCN